MLNKELYVISYLICFLIPELLHSQSDNRNYKNTGFSIMPEITYVSSSTIQMYPYSVDLFERNITESVSGDYGYGISVRKKFFSQNIAFGVSVQFLKITDSDNLTQTFSNDTLTVRARVTEELSVVPLEFKGYFNLPDFTEDLSLFLGGGLGIYYGDRKRTVLNVVSSTVSKNPGISLIVLTGMELSFTKNLSAVFEIEFRQAEYSVSSRYPVSEIKINGTIYDLEQELNSKIFVDGLKLCLGLSYNF